jgi:hypothetical protein
MSTLSLRLPHSLHKKVRELALDHISINQFIATAVGEKMSALLTLDYLEEQAARANRRAVGRLLAKVPARAPVPGDEWEPTDSGEPARAQRKGAAGRRSGKQRRRARGGPTFGRRR